MSKPQTLVIGKMFVPGHDIISETEWVRKSDYDAIASELERAQGQLGSIRRWSKLGMHSPPRTSGFARQGMEVSVNFLRYNKN